MTAPSGDPGAGERQSATPRPPAPGGGFAPSWVRGATDLYAMLLTAVIVGALFFLVAWAAPVLGPLGLGLYLAALAAPLFVRLEQRGYSAAVALAVTIGLVVVVGLAIALLTLVSARTLSESMDAYTADLQARVEELAATLAEWGAPPTIRDVVSSTVLAGVLRAAIGIAVQVGGSLVFAVVVAALLLLDAPRLSRLVAGGLGSANPVFREAPALAHTAVTYILVRVRVNAVTALGLLVLMLLTGVDSAALWAVGAFFLSFVPYLGLTLAAAVIVLGGVALNLVAENVLEPTLTGRALSLATWLVFLMFFLWVWLLGPVGALLSMPMTVLLVLVLEHNEGTRWVAALLRRT